jgi:nicotinate-nucleotide adenylyltransferase
MKVGIFGGLFDPPHVGHLIIAQHVLQEFGLDKILFVPAGNPPHKADYSPYQDRYTMTQLSISDNSDFSISDIERNIAEKTYTIEMIRELGQQMPDDLYLMLGSDQWREIETWKDPEALFRECRVVVVRRPHYDIEKESRFYDRIMISSAPLISISSTMIRSRIQKKLSVKYLVTPSVYNYIETNNLYKT